MEIRPATVADIPALARIHVDSWRATYAGIVPATYLNTMAYARSEATWQAILELAGRGEHVHHVGDLRSRHCGGDASGGPEREGDGILMANCTWLPVAIADGPGLGTLVSLGSGQQPSGIWLYLDDRLGLGGQPRPPFRRFAGAGGPQDHFHWRHPARGDQLWLDGCDGADPTVTSGILVT